jgi:hypothetical protein
MALNIRNPFPRLISAFIALLILLTGLGAARATDTAVLNWHSSSGPNLAGYIVYYGTSSGNYTQSVNVGLTTTGTVPGLQPSTTYYGVVDAYNTSGAKSMNSNQVSFTTPAGPSVVLTSPSNGATLGAPAALILKATATDSGATVSSVAFYSGTTYLGSATGSPYSFTWNNVAAGSYNITAVALDNMGDSSTSNATALDVAMAPPASGSMQVQPNGSFSFTVTGGSSGTSQSYDVWASPDMQNWTLLQTVTTTTGTFNFNDASAAGAQNRYYEVSLAQ